MSKRLPGHLVILEWWFFHLYYLDVSSRNTFQSLQRTSKLKMAVLAETFVRSFETVGDVDSGGTHYHIATRPDDLPWEPPTAMEGLHKLSDRILVEVRSFN